MRRDLARDGDAELAGRADRLEALARRDVRDVEAGAGERRELDVAGDHRALAHVGPAREAEPGRGPPFVHDALTYECGVLLVDDDGQAEHRGVLEGAAHEVAVRDRLAVVGDRDDSLRLHRADLGELDALEALRDGADREDTDDAGLAGASHDERDGRRVVRDGVRVRHRADGREAAGGRGARAARDRLLVLEAGLPEVRVQVHEPRGDDEARRLDDFGALGGDLLVHLRDHAVLQQDVERLVEVARGVDDAPAPEEDRLAAHSSSPLAPMRR